MIHLYLLGLAVFMLYLNMKAGSRVAKVVSFCAMWAAIGVSVGIAISSYIATGGITS